MYNNIPIETLDSFGRGIAHINNKVIFVKNALPGEEVDLKITLDKKRYSEAIVTKYHITSSKRIVSTCPYFNKCGGCNLLFYNYKDTLEFKLNKVRDLLAQNKIKYDNEIAIIENEHPLFYRNKISLKIVNNKLGFYESKTHLLVEIKECQIASKSINEVIKNYQLLNITNGNLTIRTNSNNEILLIINSIEQPNIDIKTLKNKVKLVGIVYNAKTIYGQNFYYERIYHKLFKVSYDSFFQVNPYIIPKLFNLLENNLIDSHKILDLYCGVGTLSIIASQKWETYGVEIIPNAVINATFNAKLNNSSAQFMLGDVSKTVSKINFEFDTLIIDPPRSGLDHNTINFILTKLPAKIIYISCDVNTLIRDLKQLLTKYQITDYKILDMFSYTYHLESFCILKLL